MISNITIGQYYPVSSIIHRLDPRLKLCSAILYIISLFWITNLTGYIFVIISLCCLIHASCIPPRFLFRGLKGILFIMLFTMVFNIFFVPGEIILWQFYNLKITQEGLLIAVKMSIRLILLLVGSSILTLTTSPIQLTDAIEALLKPFRKIGVPAHEIAMMMTIALRFIPTLLEETDKIMKAQMARGADFDTGGLIKKAKSLIPLLVPLFVSAFRHADELAMAMESRCYRGDVNRTRMKEMKFVFLDYCAAGCSTIFLIGILVSRISIL